MGGIAASDNTQASADPGTIRPVIASPTQKRGAIQHFDWPFRQAQGPEHVEGLSAPGRV